MKRATWVQSTATYALLIGLAIFLIAPFVWMVMVSLHESKAPIPELSKLNPPVKHWENYGNVLTLPDVPVLRFFLNSVVVSAVVVTGQLLVCSMAAFGFTRTRFWGRDALFSLFLLSMMFAGVITQIPVFLIVRSFGWLDSYWALIVPALSSSFNIFLLRQFMVTIPFELDEAARMDGAGSWQIYWRIILPLSRPALVAAGIMTLFATWTDFFWPLISTNSMEMRTLEVGLTIFKNSYGGNNWPLTMTASVIVLLPLVVAFLAVQRVFLSGIQLSGGKEA